MNSLRRVSLALLTGCAVAFTSLSASIVTGAPAHAQPAQSSEDMQAALEAYGSFRAHPRFGQVWVPAGVGREWRPYENGHWVYTDDWGWYWVSDQAEEDWGWVTYHYGRWAFERRIGWFWVPGDEWAPAWVDWRYGDDYIGWAPLPPDDQIDAYDTQPAPWVFVPGRYMTAPRLRSHIVTADRRAFALRSTRLVNRTVAVQGRRMAVNPGISPAFVAAVTRTALPSYRVRPRVFGSTQGVSGAVQVKGTDLRGARPGGANGRARINAVSVQRTTTLIQPAATSAKPEALSKGAGGQLGTHPPRAAQSGGSPPQEKQQDQQQQQQTPPKTPAPVAPKTTAPVAPPPPPPGAPPRSGPPPVTGPAVSPPPPRSGPPPTSAPPAPPPPAGNAPAQQGEQVKPVRPVTPQTPPPPPPPQLAPRQPSPPPPVSQPAPPSHPVAPPPPPPPPPVVKQAPPPPPPAVKQAPPPPKPGEKPAEVPK